MRRFTQTSVRQAQARKRRLRLATMAERAAIPERPILGRGPRYLIHPHVSIACGSVLSEIAHDLRDEGVAVDNDALEQVTTFLCGPDSSLFELGLHAAVSEVERLSRLLRRRRWACTHEFALLEGREQ
jgi:hypothetical protein